MKIIYFDTETTGLKNPRLVQLGYAINNHAINVNLYKPPKKIEEGAEERHGITNEQVEYYEPVATTRDAIQRLFNNSIPVAHNLVYDRRVLENEGIIIPPGIDTLKISKRLYPGLKKHKLGFLAEQLGIPHNKEDLHNAFVDVHVLRELFKRMIMSIICKDPLKSKIITKMMEYSKKKSDQDLESLPCDAMEEVCSNLFE